MSRSFVNPKVLGAAALLLIEASSSRLDEPAKESFHTATLPPAREQLSSRTIDALARTQESDYLKNTSDQRHLPFYGGLPKGRHHTLKILDNGEFIIGYDDAVTHDPAFAAYRLTRADLHTKAPRPALDFKLDARTAAAIPKDFFSGTQWQHGHLVPSRAMYLCFGLDAQKKTYSMSVVVPQNARMNHGVWEAIENFQLKCAAEFGEVWVISGPTFDQHHTYVAKADKKVEIPDALYSIMLKVEDGQIELLDLTVPQDVAPTKTLSQFTTSVAATENLTDLDFFPDLPHPMQEFLESAVRTNLWLKGRK